MRLLLSLTLLVGFAVSLSACANTVEGFGRDMERTGEKIQGR